MELLHIRLSPGIRVRDAVNLFCDYKDPFPCIEGMIMVSSIICTSLELLLYLALDVLCHYNMYCI